MSTLLEIDKLSVTFQLPTGPVTAVKDVSFTIAEGETLALVGESGSGKSVTSTAAMRLLPELAETTGAIRFNVFCIYVVDINLTVVRYPGMYKCF